MSAVHGGPAPAMDGDLGDRNRRILRILLAIVAALAIATLLVGIRWSG